MTGSLILGLWIASPPWSDSATEAKPVTKTVVKTVKVPVPTPVPVPGPTVYKVRIPQACATMVAEANKFRALIDKTNGFAGKADDLFDQAAVHMASRDVPAIEQDIGDLRGLKDDLGTTSDQQVEALDRLTSALAECRQESNK